MPFELKVILGCIACLVILGLGIDSFQIVEPGNRGVSVTLGKVDQSARAEGIAFKLPIITTIKIIPIKQITIGSNAPCFSSDLQTINVSYNVLYRIPENRVVELYQQFSGDPYKALVEPRAQEILKQITATYRAEDVVKNREKIKHAVLSKLQEALGCTTEGGGTGALIHIVDFVISNVDLTNELEKAIENKQVMEQSALAKNYELQKEQKEAEITVVRARAEAESVRIKGEALKQSPDVIQLEIVKKWDGKTPQVVSTAGGGANIILPLK